MPKLKTYGGNFQLVIISGNIWIGIYNLSVTESNREYTHRWELLKL